MKTIDPRTTRRTINGETFQRNSALFGQYRVLQRVVNPVTERLDSVVIDKKPEFCKVTK